MNLNRKAETSRSTFLILSSLLLSCVFSYGCYLEGLPVLPPGPAVAISEVTKSLVTRGSLSPAYFEATFNEAREFSKNTPGEIWQDVFAIDLDGRLVPKHSIFSSVVAAPFFALFGNLGFWIMQQCSLLALLYSTYAIVRRRSGRSLPWSTLLSTLFLSQTLFYSHSFSYDLHGCALLLAGLCLTHRFPFCGSALMGLALFVRPTNAILALPLSFAEACERRAGYMRALLGISSALIGYLVSNYLILGSPFLTSYSRLPSFQSGDIVFAPHPIGLDVTTFIHGWREKIFSAAGILPYNFCALGLPVICIALARRKVLYFEKICLGSAFAYTLYIFSYPMWMVSFTGNRFLFPAIYLYLLTFIPMLGIWEQRIFKNVPPQID